MDKTAEVLTVLWVINVCSTMYNTHTHLRTYTQLTCTYYVSTFIAVIVLS